MFLVSDAGKAGGLNVSRSKSLNLGVAQGGLPCRTIAADRGVDSSFSRRQRRARPTARCPGNRAVHRVIPPISTTDIQKERGNLYGTVDTGSDSVRNSG